MKDAENGHEVIGEGFAEYYAIGVYSILSI